MGIKKEPLVRWEKSQERVLPGSQGKTVFKERAVNHQVLGNVVLLRGAECPLELCGQKFPSKPFDPVVSLSRCSGELGLCGVRALPGG